MNSSRTNLENLQLWLRLMLFAVVLQFLHADRALALDPTRELSQYNCRTWNRQTGLPANGISAVTQTREGYLWFGTAAGVLRFDGVDFKLRDLHAVPGVRSSQVTCLAGGNSGGLWVGLEHGAFGFYDGRSFSLRGADEPGLNVRSILQSGDGTLWVAAENEIERFKPSGEKETFSLPGIATNLAENVSCGYEDRHGRVWFGTYNQGLYYWENGKMMKIAGPLLEQMVIYAIAEDLQARIWVGSSWGLYCVTPDLKLNENPHLTADVRALLVDRHGVLWVGTIGKGLGRYQDGHLDFFKETDGIKNDSVNAMAEDREGSLWVATRDGIAQISDIKFPCQDAMDNPPVREAISVASSQHGGVWISSDHGVSRFDPATKAYTTITNLPNSYVKRVYEASNGDLYLVNSTRELVVVSNGKAVYTNMAPNMVVGMTEDAEGMVVSVGGDLYRAGTNYFRPYTYTTNENPRMGWILNLASGTDGAIWVASVNGIYRVKDGGWRQWSAKDGLADIGILTITEDQDGTVWAGSLAGITRLKNDRIANISRKDGLFDDNIFAIVPDDRGNLWVDSGRGVSMLRKSDVNDFADGLTHSVAPAVFDGVEAVKVSDKTSQERVGCRSIDGRIWFPGPSGVVMIDPANIPTNSLPPPVHIESMMADGKEFPLNKSIVVPPGGGQLEFDYNALSFIAPQKVQFRYRLEGYDKDWVNAGNRRFAFYTNLKPGRYRFHVIAANADGIWNNRGSSIGIELQPHYYQATWFYLFCGGIVCLALAGIYSWRVKQLNQNRVLLESKVAERTASLSLEIERRMEVQAELERKKAKLEDEIVERKRMESEVDRVHRELVGISHRAGMAEVATSVLHNVGNVLNSVNVSASLLAENIKQSKIPFLGKIAAMLNEHSADPGNFLTNDPKGKQVIGYFNSLSEQLATEQNSAVRELESLQKNIDHIKNIVAMQQNYAMISGVTESVQASDLVEDAVRMNATALDRHRIRLVREYETTPEVTVERHRVLQILVNLIRNAKHACKESGRKDRELKLQISNGDNGVRITVTDNGVGIPEENLTRIFNHGFTTRKGGHGFGLHNSALAAREMGGSLTVHSEGPGRGASFTLKLPVQPPNVQPGVST
ncbi:MAG TPA: two-component regulator propeller domain-containing protein [Candidatus Polarisedimenticolia bacterium]|nr:two-component regulator propeller domain-containing protein [Candidatus Polarisedimenticolia bacterium]